MEPCVCLLVHVMCWLSKQHYRAAFLKILFEKGFLWGYRWGWRYRAENGCWLTTGASCVGLIMALILFLSSFLLLLPPSGSETQSEECERDAIVRSVRFFCFLLSCSARHWLQPCILVQLLTLCSGAVLQSWGIPLSKTVQPPPSTIYPQTHTH